MPSTAEQHNVEIHRNRDAWKHKPLLREIYAGFYRQIAARLSTGTAGLRVELGSGMGNIKAFIPDCLTTDLFPNPWLDGQENAYALSFADGTVADLILFDVWHHLRYPAAALAEFRRVLEPGGRVIVFDPAMGLIGRLIYGALHHEPLGLHRPIDWETPADFSPASTGYFAAQSYASRMFLRGEAAGHLEGWNLVETRPLSALAYLASGGFSKPQLYPDALLPALLRLDGWLSRFPTLFAARLLVVLEKTA